MLHFYLKSFCSSWCILSCHNYTILLKINLSLIIEHQVPLVLAFFYLQSVLMMEKLFEMELVLVQLTRLFKMVCVKVSVILGWFKSGKNDKLYIFLLFWPDSESFGKWCLKKCKNFFDSTTLMPAKSVPKFYYITHLCEMEQNRKFNFFSFFKNKIEFCCLNTLPT